MQSQHAERSQVPAGMIGRLTAALMLLFLFAGPVQTADAQQWGQRATVLTDVESGQGTRALLDTVATRLRKQDTLVVRRSPQHEPTTVYALTDSLLDKGLGMQSANRILVDYEFEIVDNELIEQIRSLQFVYRTSRPAEPDVPILHVNAQRERFAEMLLNAGIPDEQNLEIVHFFVDELSFPSLALNQDVRVISIGGETLRGEFDQRRKVLVRQLKAFIYEKDKVYRTQLLASE